MRSPNAARPATAETVNGSQTRAVAGADEQRLSSAPAAPQGSILPRVIEARLRDTEARRAELTYRFPGLAPDERAEAGEYFACADALEIVRQIGADRRS